MTALSETGRRLVAAPATEDLRQEYERLRFLQLEGVTDGDRLDKIITEVYPRVVDHTVRVVKPHEISTGLLREGRRFGRIDTEDFAGGSSPAAAKAAVRTAFDESGLTGYVEELVAEVRPFVEDVVGRRLRYDRAFLLTYNEADFIAPHGDTQTSQRIMLQLSVTYGCRTALRVLRDGWMEPYYDNPGALRIHGPGIWHEVLPVLRLEPDVDPLRVLLTARLPYA